MTTSSAKTPRLLLTGGAGYIGSHTAVTLLEAGCEVVIIDNLCNSSAASVAAVQTITGRPVSFHQMDLRDQAKVEAVLRAERIDAVVHLAGLKAVGESCEKPLDYYDCNVVGTLRLLQAMQNTGVRQQDLSNSATGWHFSILRYFNPVGAHPSGEFGEDPRGVPNNLIPYIAQVAAGHSVKAMVSAFERACGKSLPVQIGPCRTGDLPALWADASRAIETFHWQPTRDLDSMCASTWRWQQAHPNGFNEQ